MQDMNEFEAGMRNWDQLSPEAQNWYLKNNNPDDIMTGMKGPDGQMMSVSQYNMGGQVRHYNEGDEVEEIKYDPLGTGAFGGEGVNSALATSLGNLSKFYEDDVAKHPAWYGTRYNPVTGGYDEIDDKGFSRDEFIAQGGAAEDFQALSPVGQFTEDQIAGRDSVRSAVEDQSYLVDNYNSNLQEGIRGEKNLTPEQLQLAQHQGYEGLGGSDYVNQYINPAVQQAQQQAIANVNSSFGQGEEFGGSANQRAATNAAVQAGLPTLTSAAQQQQQLDRQAEQYNVGQANNLAQQNVGLQNQQNVANVNANNLYDQANQQRQDAYLDRTGTALEQSLTPGNTLQALGQQQYDQNQNNINQDVQAWNYQQNLPQQQHWNQVGLGQIAQAAESQNVALEAPTGTNSGGFGLGDALGLGLSALGGGGGGGGLLGGLGSLLSNDGGKVVPPAPKRIRRR